MAAKRPLPPTPSPKPIDKAYFEIKKRYPAGNENYRGIMTANQAAQSFQDVVAESGLVDKYSNRTLMAAAAKLAKERWTAATSYGKPMPNAAGKAPYPGASKNVKKMK
jgi:hypothetical protein